MATTPTYYINSPVAGTTYYAPMWNGVISSGESINVQASCYASANGGGADVTVSALDVIIYDVTAAANVTDFNDPNVTTDNVSHSTTSGHWIKCAVKFTGATVPGSIGLVLTYTASTPFIPTTPSFSPGSGGIGSSIALTGSHFTDATLVEFNGVSASFTVNSDTSITATVPSGATTGLVKVGNPAGSANSSGNFLVAVVWVNTGTPASPSWVAAQVYINTGTPASPVWTPASAVYINTGTPASPVWTPGS